MPLFTGCKKLPAARYVRDYLYFTDAHMKNFNFNLSAGEISDFISGKLYGPDSNIITGFSTDSRDVTDGDLFFAIRGERVDGNRFVDSATKNGAVAVICNSLPDLTDKNVSYILTEDTVSAMADLARAYKNIISPKYTVAVTGSVGKTTTRQLIFSVMNEKYKTATTKGNFNSEIGLPLTILSLERGDEAFLCELGMNHAGEITRLSEIAKPDIAVITNIGTSHIEYLGSREGIRDAKLEIRAGMSSGVLIVDGDEPLLEGKGDIYCSIESNNADYFADNITETEEGMSFSVRVSKEGKTVEGFSVPLFGKQMVKDALYAIAVARELDIGYEDIKSGLLKFENVGYRQKISEIGSLTLIEDCYNASPESMRSSAGILVSFAERKGGRAVAVLGDMGELGDKSAELHKQVGDDFRSAGCDIIITYGEESKLISDSHHFDIGKETELVEFLKKIKKENDVILFKASRFIEMEKISERFKETL